MINHRKRIAALVLALILIVTPILESYAVVNNNAEVGEELDTSIESNVEEDENVSHETPKEAKVSIEIEAEKDLVGPEEDAVFLINADIEGEKEAFKDKEIILDLGDNELSDILKDNIKDFKIAGVSPEYKKEENQLIYDLVDLETGETKDLKLSLKANTNEKVKNKYIEVKMLYKSNGVEEALIEKEAKVELEFKHNTVIAMSPVNKEVLSGQDAIFQIDTKFTGSKKEYEDRKIVIELGNNELSDSLKLEDIKIAGVIPKHNEEEKQLVYDLANLETGKTDRINLKLKTENGVTADGKEIKVKLKYKDKDNLLLEEKAVSKINAKTNLSINKEYKGVYNESTKKIIKRSAKPGDILVWQVDYEIIINNKEYGNLFLKEGSKISISDSPDKHQTLLGILEGNTLNKNKKIYKIDAPSMEEQEKEGGLNIKGSVDFATRLNKSLSFDKNGELIIDNNASISAVGFDSVSLEESADNTNKSSTKTSYKVVDSKEINPGKLEGTAYVPAHMGPNDEIGTPELYKPDKLKSGELLRVDETALLGFAFNFTSHGIKGVNGTHNASNDYYSDYRLEYIIDKNLIFQEVTSIKDEFIYVPNSEKYGALNITYPDEVKPRYNIVGYSSEGSSKKPLFKIKNPGKGETFTRKELGLEDTDRVDIVAFEFDYAPVGMYLRPRESIMPKLVFSIEKGYRGEVWNDMRLFIKGDPEGKSQYIVEGGLLYGDHQPKNQKDKRQVFHRRGARVVDKTIDYKIVGDIAVRLNKNTNGKVSVGENTLNIEYKNLSTSNGDMKENVGLVLLPGGVKAINDGSLSIIENFNGTGRDLIAFKVDDISRMNLFTKKIKVNITEKAAKNLIFDAELYPDIDIYIDKATKKPANLEAVDHNTDNPLGAYDNTIKDHKDYILGLDLENKDIFEKLLNNPETYRKKLKASTIYNLVDGYGLTTEHQVGLDGENWTDQVKVLDENDLYYRLHVKNETDKAVSNLKIVDIFPHIGDLGITDNIPRDSEIFINDIQSIQIINKNGTDIKDKFNIYYVKEANINKDEFFEEELSGKYKPDNPEGAVNPNWKEVSNEGFKAGALKIELKPGYNLNIGEEVEVIIKAKSPVTDEVVEAIGKEKFEEVSQLTAWNSFAVSSKEFQTVEPKRIGVQIGIADTPEVEKQVIGAGEDNQIVKGSKFSYKITSKIENIENVYRIYIEDKLDKDLEFLSSSAELRNESGELIDSENYVLGVDSNNKLTLEIIDDSLIKQLKNGQIDIIVDVRLNKDTNKDTINNTATITVNNNPKKETEKVPVTPIEPTEPKINKKVEDTNNNIVNYGKEFTYKILNELPNDINEYKMYEITDKLDDRLDILDIKVLIDGEERQDLTLEKAKSVSLIDSLLRVGPDIELKKDNNKISLKVNKPESLRDKSKIELEIKVKLNVNEENMEIKNQANLTHQSNREDSPKDTPTEEVVVKTPKNPEVKKSMVDLEDGQELVEGKKFSYKISIEFGEVTGYDSFILKDNLDPDLELLSAEVLLGNTKNENLSEKVSFDNENNSVSLEIKDGWDELKGEKLNLLINVKLKESLKNRVNNEASYQLNNNPEEKTNIVGVKPIKPTEPEIEKEALEPNNQDKKIVNYGEEFKYKITNSLPNDIEEYENYIIEDELDKALDLKSVKVTIGEEEKEFTLVDGEQSGGIKGTKLTVKDNKLELKIEEFKKLEGLEKIVLELNVKLKEDAKIENNILPNNAKVTYNHKEREEGSQEDREIVKTPKDPKLSKNIEGQGLNKVIAKGAEFDYILTTKLINIEGYEKVIIRDELDKRLKHISSVVKIDGKDSNYEISVENQTVSLELNEEEVKSLKDKNIEIFIRVKVEDYIEPGSIDNEAKIQVNNNPEKPSNKVTINPKVDTPPNILKEVNKDKEDIQKKDIINYGEEFKYTVSSKLPITINQYSSYRITDTIDENLKLISVDVKVLDEEVETLDPSQNKKLETFASKLSVEGQEVIFEITHFDKFEGKVVNNKEEDIDIVLTFTVKLKDNAVLERHQIDNTAELIFKEDTDSEEKKKSSSVTVIVPENPGIEKELVDLNEFDKVVQGTKFAYKVSSFLDDLDNVNKITLEDELDKRLSFEEAQVELDDGTILKEDKYTLNHNKDSNIVSLVIDDKDTLKSFEGKTLSLVIQVRLDYGNDISQVKNQASVRVNNNPKNKTEKVTVEPEKPTEPKITKKVEGDKEGTVNYKEEFSYKLSNDLPNDIEEYKSYKISDQIDSRLEILKAQVFIDGKEIEELKIKKESKVLKTVKGLFKKGEDFTFIEKDNLLELDILNPQKLKDKEKIDILIEVKLKDGAEEGKIRNTAFINKESRRDEKPEDIPSNEIVVKTPEEPDVEKTIIGLESGSQVVAGKEISYKISTKFDDITGYKSFVISDSLDKDLDIKDVKVKVNRLDNKELNNYLKIDEESNTIMLELGENQIKSLENKKLDLVITVEVKNLDKLKETIENQADYKLNNNPKKETEIVTIKPEKPTDPGITKSVSVDGMVNKGEVFSYTISSDLPNDIEEYLVYEIRDELNENLDLIKLKLTLDDESREFTLEELERQVDYLGLSLSKEGNIIKVKVKDFAAMEGKTKLNIVLDVELNKAIENYEITNIAKLKKQKKKDKTSEDIPTEEVVVKTPEDPDVEKTIEGIEDGDNLVAGKEISYKISTKFDDIEGYRSFVVSDSLDEDLEIKSVKVKVDGETDQNLTEKVVINKEDNKVILELKDELKELAGKTLDLVISVEVLNMENLKDTIENTAEYQLNNNPVRETETVTIKPIEPVEPDVSKSVERDRDGVVDYKKEFNYKISTLLPNDIEDYKLYKLSDKLDDRLEFVGLTIDLDGKKKSLTKKDLDKEKEVMGLLLSEENNLLEVQVKDFDNLEGKSKLDLILNVRLKEDVEEGEIRNIANLEKQSKRDEKPEDIPTNEVVVKTPKTPEISKEIKNKDSYSKDKPASVLLGESIEYSIKLPVDNISGYDKIYIEDTIDEKLDIEDVKVFIVGEESSEELEKLANISANKIQVEITDKNIISKLDGKEIEVLIKAKVKNGLNLDIIENTASIKINNNPSRNSNTVYLKPKRPIEVEIPGKPEIPEEKEKPNIEKKINGLTKLKNVEIGKEYAYTVDLSIPSDIADYKKLVIEDKIDDRLLIKDVKVKADGKTYSNYSLNQSKNLVTANFMDIDDLTSISDLSLEIVIELKDLDYQDGDIISNIANIIYQYKDDGIEGDIPSNEVIIVPPIDWEREDPDKPELEKTGENPEGDGSGNNKPNRPGDEDGYGDGSGSNNPNRPGGEDSYGDGSGSNNPNRPGGEDGYGDGSGSNNPNRPGGNNLGSGLLPKTGDSSSIYTSLFGLGLMLLGYVLLRKRKNA